MRYSPNTLSLSPGGDPALMEFAGELRVGRRALGMISQERSARDARLLEELGAELTISPAHERKNPAKGRILVSPNAAIKQGNSSTVSSTASPFSTRSLPPMKVPLYAVGFAATFQGFHVR